MPTTKITSADQQSAFVAVQNQMADNLDRVLITSQAADYTFVLADGATEVEGTKATAQVFTIPPNSSVAFPVGTVINARQMGAGQITITAGAGVTLRAPNGAKTAGLYSTVTIVKRATDEWIVGGDTENGVLLDPGMGDYGLPGGHLSSAQVATTLPSTARTHYHYFYATEAVVLTDALTVVSTAAAACTVFFGVVALDAATRQPLATGLVNQSSLDASTTGSKEVVGLSWALPPGLYATVVTTNVINVAMRGWFWSIDGLPQGHKPDVTFAHNPAMRNNVTNGGGGAFANPVPNATMNGLIFGVGFYHNFLYKWTRA